ncbi:DNA cytosine methyltransferase [Phenylobacterium sp.]|uniref:DNA cytosine methyltransferase n=1 Tax=Phenylobacterium sp. TaxID=1871053 RepID=UPI002CA0DD54|nr:DNA cytosine methyltransferase [Phenylobacterium sp.]HLZ77144.1 DNA cytosine methyltransferase [Phenylobacterium sp.]
MPTRPAAGSLMARIKATIQSRGTSERVAAAEIGVGLSTLQIHLAGEHVRSDSAQKYENWLAGRRDTSNVFVLQAVEPDIEPEDALESLPDPPANPRLVVDIFSGCGGLSLGFEMLGSGKHFRTVLALDIAAAPIATLNRNAALLGHGDHPVGRTIDLTEFINEAEFLAFYLQHSARVLGEGSLSVALHSLRSGAFPGFLDAIAHADRTFLDELNEVRSGSEWRASYDRIDHQALSQTSVVGFHEKLRLPRPSSKVAGLPSLLWSERCGDLGRIGTRQPKLRASRIEDAQWEWDQEVASLVLKQEADGCGQLTASARRVSSFVTFLDSPGMKAVREVWVRWRARRMALRSDLFLEEAFAAGLRNLYRDTSKVSVLVGGPPCQGFSRIGRGKIRSLRDARVHAHGSAEAGDARNLLFQQYVMVLGALRPDVFLFENVQHFQSVVKADGVEFQATEVLAEAIANVSDGEVAYQVASDVLDASKYGVPQSRQRYFMVGVRVRASEEAASRDAAGCLTLRRDREAALSLALAGLPAPGVVGGGIKASAVMSAHTLVDDSVLGEHPFAKWVRQPRHGTDNVPAAVDAHAARAARADDAAFFGLLGPGRRWMDYRADASETAHQMRRLVRSLASLSPREYEQVAAIAQRDGDSFLSLAALRDLESRIDGALPLRLLLEHAGEKLGARHHLLSPKYLAKREGNHGDWVSRMDGTRPAKTMVSHMGKDTYAYVHPSAPRTISVREAARIQSFPDWFAFGDAALTDAFKMIGNAVPPMLSHAIAAKVAHVLSRRETVRSRRKA